jgi:hypothetical protein
LIATQARAFIKVIFWFERVKASELKVQEFPFPALQSFVLSVCPLSSICACTDLLSAAVSLNFMVPPLQALSEFQVKLMFTLDPVRVAVTDTASALGAVSAAMERKAPIKRMVLFCFTMPLVFG